MDSRFRGAHEDTNLRSIEAAMTLCPALFRKIDNHLLRVSDLDAAISFYRDKLGHQLLWRSDDSAGFALPETDAEPVSYTHLDVYKRQRLLWPIRPWLRVGRESCD